MFIFFWNEREMMFIIRASSSSSEMQVCNETAEAGAAASALVPMSDSNAPDGEQRAKAARREDNSRKTPKFECQSLILYTANRWITEKIKASTSWSPENPEDHIFKVRRTGGLTGITCQIFAFFQICVNLVK